MGELETIELLEEVMKTLQKPPPKPAFGKSGSLADLEDLFSSGSEAEESGSEGQDTDAVLELLEQTMQGAPSFKAAKQALVVHEETRPEAAHLIPEALTPTNSPEIPSIPHPSEVSEACLSTLNPTDFTSQVVLSEAELPISEAQLEAITALREYYRSAEQDNRL